MADINAVLPKWHYSVRSVNNITRFNISGVYNSISVSVFIGENISNTSTMPYSVVSSVLVLKNSSSANALLHSSLALSENASITTITAYGIQVVNYTYENKSEQFFVRHSYAVISPGTLMVDIAKNPIFQSQVSFAYCNLVGDVTLTGYAQMNGSPALPLARLLYEKLVNAGISC